MLRRVLASAAAFLLSLTSAVAWATVQRTFVASYGNDSNACSLTLPCRGFAAAVAQTNAGGEVIVLDSAGYGIVTVAQSVSITAPPGVYAGITVPAGGTGILIDGVGITVKLSGLSINGMGTGSIGIHMVNGTTLSVADCAISNLQTLSGTGILIESAAVVTVTGTSVENAGSGIMVGFGAFATVADSKVNRIRWAGIEASGGPADSLTSLVITDTVITGTGPGVNTTTSCIINSGNAGATANVSATRVTASGCLYGINNSPIFIGTMTVSNSTVTANATGFYQHFAGGAAGSFISLGNNTVSGNYVTDVDAIVTTIGGK